MLISLYAAAGALPAWIFCLRFGRILVQCAVAFLVFMSPEAPVFHCLRHEVSGDGIDTTTPETFAFTIAAALVKCSTSSLVQHTLEGKNTDTACAAAENSASPQLPRPEEDDAEARHGAAAQTPLPGYDININVGCAIACTKYHACRAFTFTLGDCGYYHEQTLRQCTCDVFG